MSDSVQAARTAHVSEDKETNLCTSCWQHFGSCLASVLFSEHGDAVIGCTTYEPEFELPEGVKRKTLLESEYELYQ